MHPEHYDERNTLRALLFLHLFVDCVLHLAHLLDQNVPVWIYFLCKLLLHAILLDETALGALCYS